MLIWYCWWIKSFGRRSKTKKVHFPSCLVKSNIWKHSMKKQVFVSKLILWWFIKGNNIFNKGSTPVSNSVIFLDNKTIITCFPTHCDIERIKWNMTSNKSLTVNECKESFKTRHGYIKFCTPRVATLLQFLQYHYHHFYYLILTPSSNLLTTEGTYILVSSTNINCVCGICILAYLFLYPRDTIGTNESNL